MRGLPILARANDAYLPDGASSILRGEAGVGSRPVPAARVGGSSSRTRRAARAARPRPAAPRCRLVSSADAARGVDELAGAKASFAGASRHRTLAPPSRLRALASGAVLEAGAVVVLLTRARRRARRRRVLRGSGEEVRRDHLDLFTPSDGGRVSSPIIHSKGDPWQARGIPEFYPCTRTLASSSGLARLREHVAVVVNPLRRRSHGQGASAIDECPACMDRSASRR